MCSDIEPLELVNPLADLCRHIGRSIEIAERDLRGISRQILI
jgi:hypothetical protein